MEGRRAAGAAGAGWRRAAVELAKGPVRGEKSMGRAAGGFKAADLAVGRVLAKGRAIWRVAGGKATGWAAGVQAMRRSEGGRAPEDSAVGRAAARASPRREAPSPPPGRSETAGRALRRANRHGGTRYWDEV